MVGPLIYGAIVRTNEFGNKLFIAKSAIQSFYLQLCDGCAELNFSKHLLCDEKHAYNALIKCQ